MKLKMSFKEVKIELTYTYLTIAKNNINIQFYDTQP